MDKNTSHDTTEPDGARGRLFFVLVLVLSLIGLGVSVELTDIHHATHTDPNFESICAVSDTVNCETVARSPYSVFLGAPVSVWGILGYIILAFFAGWGLKPSKLHDRYPAGILFGLITAAFSAAAALAYISFTRIDSLCLFCMALYGINSVLLVVIVTFHLRLRQNPIRLFFRDIAALVHRPLVFSAVALPAIGATVALMVAIPPYWQHVGWQELPHLPTGIDQNGHHWIGARSPLVTIVEYSDYQCPFCRKAHKDLRMLAGQYPNEVRLIHRHMPLDNACNDAIDRPFHKQACKFAKAAECAAEQHMFWQMNDALFSVQDTMKADDVDVEMLAVELGLDRSSFNECMAKKGFPKRIKEDVAAAKRLNIQGTPTFYIGAQPYEGFIPPATIKAAIEAARKKQKK